MLATIIMPKQSCPQGTFCSPILQDGRSFTNYTRNQVMNQMIRCSNNIRTNNEYRCFLQRNAEKFMLNSFQGDTCRTACHKFDACKRFGVCHRFGDYVSPASPYGCL